MKTIFLTIVVAFELTCSTGLGQTTDTVLTVSQNPFVTSTNLTIHDLTNDTVTFKIYNPLGQVVADFFDNLVITGTFTMTFNADTLPDGFYFAILTKNSQNHSLKLVKDQTATTLTEQQKQPTSIQVYPNPTADQLTISTNFDIKELEIYDLNGKKLLESKNGRYNNLDIKNFKSGLYLLHLKTTETTYIEKIMKK